MSLMSSLLLLRNWLEFFEKGVLAVHGEIGVGKQL